MPTSCSAFFTSSSLNGLMIASTFFMALPRIELGCQSRRAVDVRPGPQRAGPRPLSYRFLLLHRLAMERKIEPLALHLGVDAQSDGDIHKFKKDQRRDHVVDDGH